MNDTDTQPGLPDQFPAHLQSAERRIRAALATLDLTEWQFAVKKNIVIGARNWGGGVAIDTVAVVQPGYAIGHRVFVVDGKPGDMWEGHGTVDEIVTLVRSWENETRAGTEQ